MSAALFISSFQFFNSKKNHFMFLPQNDGQEY
ncbi:hypothetical protein SAMN06265218_11536 [Fodinibius sediminis]|uniref:Uncharacterized protein n=1 Tax=Fodinibius sediminis TaxID=1214077 RepID=A0A521ED45_9BACT|nr:hypothetical protein SAMN06265218_11536 [Fodinibius sediminis]